MKHHSLCISGVFVFHSLSVSVTHTRARARTAVKVMRWTWRTTVRDQEILLTVSTVCPHHLRGNVFQTWFDVLCDNLIKADANEAHLNVNGGRRRDVKPPWLNAATCRTRRSSSVIFHFYILLYIDILFLIILYPSYLRDVTVLYVTYQEAFIFWPIPCLLVLCLSSSPSIHHLSLFFPLIPLILLVIAICLHLRSLLLSLPLLHSPLFPCSAHLCSLCINYHFIPVYSLCAGHGFKSQTHHVSLFL